MFFPEGDRLARFVTGVATNTNDLIRLQSLTLEHRRLGHGCA